MNIPTFETNTKLNKMFIAFLIRLKIYYKGS